MYRDAEPLLAREWMERAEGYRRGARVVHWHVRRVLAERAGRIAVGLAAIGLFVAFALLIAAEHRVEVIGWSGWPTGLLVLTVPILVGASLLGSSVGLFVLRLALRRHVRPTGDVHADLARLAVSPTEIARRMALRLERASLGLPAATYIVFGPLLVTLALFAFFSFWFHGRLTDFDPAIAVVVRDYGLASFAVLAIALIRRRLVLAALVFALPALDHHPLLTVAIIFVELLWMISVVGHGDRTARLEKQILS